MRALASEEVKRTRTREDALEGNQEPPHECADVGFARFAEVLLFAAEGREGSLRRAAFLQSSGVAFEFCWEEAMTAMAVEDQRPVRELRVPVRDPACQERMLFVRRRHENDGAAREELITRFSSLPARLARRYRHTSEPVEDLCQVAQLGLIKAIDGFYPDRGFTFGAYAIHHPRGVAPPLPQLELGGACAALSAGACA